MNQIKNLEKEETLKGMGEDLKIFGGKLEEYNFNDLEKLQKFRFVIIDKYNKFLLKEVLK